MIDLYQESDQDIKAHGGKSSVLLFALKHVWNMTPDKLRSVIKLCIRYSKKDYFKKFRYLIGYVLRASSYSIKEFKEIEGDILKDEGGQTMPSTYDLLINEGLQQGLKKGRQEGLEQGIEKGVEKGMEKGMEQGRKKVALNMLKNGLDSQIILKSTGLSEKELEDLKMASK